MSLDVNSKIKSMFETATNQQKLFLQLMAEQFKTNLESMAEQFKTNLESISIQQRTFIQSNSDILKITYPDFSTNIEKAKKDLLEINKNAQNEMIKMIDKAKANIIQNIENT